MRTLITTAVALLATTLAIPASAETRKCSVGKLLELPVTMSYMRPIVPATINGHEIKLIADSGAFYSNISPGSAADLSLKLIPAPMGFQVSGVGGYAAISITTVKDFGIGPIVLHNIEFMVGGSETGSTGLLGQNVLGFADVEYDLADGAIRLMQSHNCEHANFAYWAGTKAYSVLDIEPPSQAQPHTIGTVLLNGVKIKALFDTGAPTSILSTKAAGRAGIKPDMPGVESAGETSGIGRHTLPTWIGAFESLAIGDEEIRKIHLRFGDVGGENFDMLIGADFFMSHRVYVSKAQHKMYFTYNGGPVFDLGRDRAKAIAAANPKGSAAAGDAGAPSSADEFSRRGNALVQRLDFVGALADLTRACELAPGNAEFRYQRALILMRTEQSAAAKADLDRALMLKPTYPEALLFRASLKMKSDDKAGARMDVDSAEHVVGSASDLRLAIGNFYEEMEDYGASITQYTRWITAHPDDRRMGNTLNSRCWARTLAGRELDKAIADCDRALKLQPHTAAYLDSRGLARLRNGDVDKAQADYNAALELEPKQAWSLYGRGLIERRKGMAAQGTADTAAAIALEKSLPDRMQKLGLEGAPK
ncbi:MAG: aspartyl protease family protein [Sphingomonas sp.]